MATHKQKFFKTYAKQIEKLGKQTLSKEEISKISSVPMEILDEVYDRGIGAYRTNPTSVRTKGSFKKDPSLKRTPLRRRLSPQQWAMARVYGFVAGNPKQIDEGRPDRDLYLRLTPYQRKKMKKVQKV